MTLTGTVIDISKQASIVKSSFTDLPPDLHLYLLDFLSWPSLSNLRICNSSFANLVSQDELIKRHSQCVEATLLEEQKRLKKIEADYWLDVEEAFRSTYFYSSYTSSSLDPDRRAEIQSKTCMSKELPCYHCLQWKPSRTDGDHFAYLSAFTRGRMTLSFDLGARNARRRICIDCGIRTGLYVRGNRVKYTLICSLCGTLVPPLETLNWTWCDPKETWKIKKFCSRCIQEDFVCRLTEEQVRHESRWAQYELSLKAGKLYREQNGRELRQERNVRIAADNIARTSDTRLQTPKPASAKYCPIMGRMGHCTCSKTAEPPQHFHRKKANLQAVIQNNR